MEKMLFQIMRAQILTTFGNPETHDMVSPATAFGWQYGIYPFFDRTIAEPFEEFFRLRKGQVGAVTLFMDEFELGERETISWFELEQRFVSSNIMERHDLENILAYIGMNEGRFERCWAELATADPNRVQRYRTPHTREEVSLTDI